MAGSLEPVSVEEWLGAMPPEVVQPSDRAAAVDSIVADMPLPPGADLSPVRDAAGVLDRYQLIARTTSVVACGWFVNWAEALKSGDDAEAARAVQAMRTSRDWDALREIRSEGAYAQFVWDYADRMAADDRELLGPSGSTTTADGRKFVTGPGYATAFGCEDQQYKRPVEDR